MGSDEKMKTVQKVNGKATILSIGTANPTNEMTQEEFVNFYFRVTNWGDDMTEIKEKFKLICKKTGIKKRYMHLTEKFLKENPQICDENASSFHTREDILIDEVPKLGHEASLKAISEWGQPKSKITHIIFCTVCGIAMPGCDYELLKLLDLGPSVQRFMLYQQGCYGGGTVLRLAKLIVETTPGARVLAVCSEFNTMCFRGPGKGNIGPMVGHALFTDGASAMIIGANPDESLGERPIFELVSAFQSLIPDTKWGAGGQLREMGLNFYLSKKLSEVVANNIEKPLLEAFAPLNINNWNSIFYAVHPGGPAILDKVEAQLELTEHKLEASRHVLSEFGNMWSTTVIFVLDEIRKRSFKDGMSTTGQGLSYGVLIGVGPGITVETVVLRSFPINN
ncbi:chalcone synthase-like [Silene latifolia]|uniref:chalcone synthase-like n=1 Tax=Silene latifolia TaxID=37657 RepID=UPI003D76AA1A